MLDDDDPMFGDDPEVPDELNVERCPDCGAWPEDYHEMDCAYDDDDDIEDDEDEDVEDFA
jgi:hypothetical protein